MYFFDALHDMGDPVESLQELKSILNDEGKFMLVEPFAEDELKDNLTPASAMMYGFSTIVVFQHRKHKKWVYAWGLKPDQKRLIKVLRRCWV